MPRVTAAPLTVRRANRSDAPTLAAMVNALNLHEEIDYAAHFTPEMILRDGFGERPAFSALLATRGEHAVGYAFFHDIYNTDLGGRGLWLVDLYVDSAERSHGAGRALLAAVAQEAVASGAVSLWWGVRSSNARARTFYATVGASDWDSRILELDGAPLQRLAAEAL